MKIDEKLLREIMEGSSLRVYERPFGGSAIYAQTNISSIPSIRCITIVDNNTYFFKYTVSVTIKTNESFIEVELDIPMSSAGRLFKRFKKKVREMEAIEEELKRRKELDFFKKAIDNTKKDLGL